MDTTGSIFLYFVLLELDATTLATYAAQVVVIIFLLVGSALMSGSEVSFFSLSPQQIASCKEDNSSLAAKKLITLLDRPRNLLATILILNNLINVSISTLATYMMLDIIGHDAEQGLAIAILTFLTTAAIVLFGEVTPKIYANQRGLQMALLVSPLFSLLVYLTKPFAWLLMTGTNLVEHRIKKKGYEVSIEEINHAVEMTTGNQNTSEQKEILKSVVNFGTLTVKQIMKSRMHITAADLSWNFEQLLRIINDTRYSRIPVYNESIDNIEGFLYIKDLLPYLDKNADFKWQGLIRRQIFAIPENKRISALMREFQEKRVHIAIVVDEYGGILGLITLEDIIEEIVGEINDEFDTHEVDFQQIDNHTFVFEGKTSLHDFCKIVHLDQHLFDEIKGENESLGGLLLELFLRIPSKNEQVSYKDIVFIIEEADNRRVRQVRVLLSSVVQSKES